MRALVRLILTLLGLVALGGGAAGGWWLYKHLERKQYEDGTPAFLDLDPVNITIMREGVPVEIRTYWMTIETRQGTPMGRVLQAKDGLRSEYVRYLSALAGRAGPENIDNEPYVKQQLVKASEEMLKVTAVKQVLFRRFQFRDLQFD
jgi:hypothetical protein